MNAGRYYEQRGMDTRELKARLAEVMAEEEARDELRRNIYFHYVFIVLRREVTSTYYVIRPYVASVVARPCRSLSLSLALIQS